MKNVNALTAASIVHHKVEEKVSKTPFELALNALLRAELEPMRATWAQDKASSKPEDKMQNAWFVLGQIAPF